MKQMPSIAELLNAGLRFEADEAVAIAQQLIETLRHADEPADAGPPYGPPTVANVYLKADGSIRCAGSSTTPAVSEIAIFLDTLLPAGSPRLPGGLRYAIARGMLEVDVAPFDSLEDFSQALARFEHGARDAVVRAALQRAGSQCTALVRPAAFDRRIARATATDLRRELRNADARLYQQQLMRAAAMMSAPKIAPEIMSERPAPRARSRAVPAIAACFGAGLLLVAAGEFMHTHPWIEQPGVPVVAAPRLAVADPAPTVRVQDASINAVSPRAIAFSSALADTSNGAVTPRASAAKPIAKRSARSSGAEVHRVRAQRGVMDRLRLGWLRDAFKRS